MVQSAVEILQRGGKPFLLIVEAALPDKASHQNQAKRALEEVLEMDAVLGWLHTNLDPGVLIMATADHGTGGMALNGYLPPTAKGETLLGLNPASGIPTISWATGPGAATPTQQESPENTREPQHAQDHPEARQPAAAHAGSAMHTGGDVWLIGRGPGSERVRGFLDNTDVFRIMRETMLGQ